MKKVLIIREPDDAIVDTQILLVSPHESEDFYFVFRGDPEHIVALLEKISFIVKSAFSAEMYEELPITS